MVIVLCLITIGLILTLVYFMRINYKVSPRIVLGLAGYVLIPLADNLSDLAYLVSSKFAYDQLFLVLLIFYFVQMTGFTRALLKRKAWCKFRILPMPKWLFFDEYNNLLKFLVTGMAVVPCIVINFYCLPLLLVGMFLWSIKAFTLRCFSDYWFAIWTGRDDVNASITSVVDTEMLNDSLFWHLCLESIPSLAFSIINNIGVYGHFEYWNVFAQISLIMTILNICAGSYRFAYYRLYLDIKLDVIPIDFSLFGLNVFSISTEELEAIASEGRTGLVVIDREWGSSTRALSTSSSPSDLRSFSPTTAAAASITTGTTAAATTSSISPLFAAAAAAGRGNIEMRETIASSSSSRHASFSISRANSNKSNNAYAQNEEEMASLIERQGNLELEVTSLKEEIVVMKDQQIKLGAVYL